MRLPPRFNFKIFFKYFSVTLKGQSISKKVDFTSPLKVRVTSIAIGSCIGVVMFAETNRRVSLIFGSKVKGLKFSSNVRIIAKGLVVG
jgi:hypothetical protein